MKKIFFLIFITLVAAFGGLLFGFDIAIFSGTIPFIKPQFNLNDIQLGLVGGSLYLGCILGSSITGYLSDLFGRKSLLLFSSFIFMLSSIMMGLSKTSYELIIWRTIAGIGVGSASVLSPLYIAEVSPARLRGRLVTLNQLTIVIGILIAYLSNYILSGYDNNWRLMFFSGAVPSLLFFINVFFVPESPRWLMMKGKESKSYMVLLKINDNETAKKEIEEIKNIFKQQTKGKLADLFKKEYRFIVILGIIIAIFQQISGANVVFFYAPVIFEKAGMNIENQLFQQILIGSTNLIFTLVAMWLVDKIGRKILMLSGSLLMSLWLLIIGLLYHSQNFNAYWLTFFVLLFIATYATTLAPVTWVLLSEIFPSKIRGKAMSLATGMLWVACFALTFTFPILFGSGKNTGLLTPLNTFLIFSGINLIYFLILYKNIPETKGKSLEEIEKTIKK